MGRHYFIVDFGWLVSSEAVKTETIKDEYSCFWSKWFGWSKCIWLGIHFSRRPSSLSWRWCSSHFSFLSQHFSESFDHFSENMEDFSNELFNSFFDDPMLVEKNPLLDMDLDPPTPGIQAEHSYSLSGDSAPQSPLMPVKTEENASGEYKAGSRSICLNCTVSSADVIDTVTSRSDLCVFQRAISLESRRSAASKLPLFPVSIKRGPEWKLVPAN